MSGLAPLVSGLAAPLSLIFLAAYASNLWRQVAVIVTNLSGIGLAYVAIIDQPVRLLKLGINLSSDNSGLLAFMLACVCVVSVNTLAWVFGRLAITRSLHVGTDTDRAILVHRQASLGLEVAKQTERLGIARDLTDLLVQRVTSVVSLSEGAKFLAKADPDSAVRTINRIAESSGEAQSELRKLYDLLHEGHELTAAPPSLAELPGLILAMRQLGFNASLTVDGSAFQVKEGAELCIFKIVFESLENVKKNTPANTDVAVNFYWTTAGVQILVKDNGIETQRRADLTPEQMLEGYTVEDDMAELTAIVEGATLGALRERAALYEGTIEVTQVAGVGFTVSAFFPKLREIAGV
jgi:signal transduction histidine kinase